MPGLLQCTRVADFFFTSSSSSDIPIGFCSDPSKAGLASATIPVCKQDRRRKWFVGRKRAGAVVNATRLSEGGGIARPLGTQSASEEDGGGGLLVGRRGGRAVAYATRFPAGESIAWPPRAESGRLGAMVSGDSVLVGDMCKGNTEEGGTRPV